MSDPVASKSGFLCMYMKNHHSQCQISRESSGQRAHHQCEMSSIDFKGMTFVYKLKSRQLNTTRVSFDPLLSGYEEVKTRLLSMKAEAQEGLGMIPRTVVIVGIALFAYVYSLSPPPPDTTFLSVTAMDAFFSPAHAFRNATGLCLSFQTTCASLRRQYVKDAIVTAAYVGCTTIFGYPMRVDLKRRVQQKAIESVTKVE
ncbi:hypothetical protein BDR07DRAFT_1463887 [Suillus spraguei]|nr:hypothetical protein BDR07DRAFT_1463887 [Suillus spraguei]